MLFLRIRIRIRQSGERIRRIKFCAPVRRNLDSRNAPRARHPPGRASRRLAHHAAAGTSFESEFITERLAPTRPWRSCPTPREAHGAVAARSTGSAWTCPRAPAQELHGAKHTTLSEQLRGRGAPLPQVRGRPARNRARPPSTSSSSSRPSGPRVTMAQPTRSVGQPPRPLLRHGVPHL